ncbi:amidase [Embleya hyalina]|uniref:Amidase n=1 Tax=Embleya hyalina TaxID=516124 RepID=A0A401YE36_9ACTN|nr:amidase [Embleya hyalina]GCD92832.1 amidase [Embleya hyalina]
MTDDPATTAIPPAPGIAKPPHHLTVAEAAAAIARRALSPVELAEAILDRIARVEPAVAAFAHRYPVHEVLARAHAAEALLRDGRRTGPLHGIPVGIKDNYLTEGKPTENNSRVHAGYIPDHDATAVRALKNAGAVILGKTHTAELALGDLPPTRNPWDPYRVPGYSSAGSAAGVAAGEFPLGLGSDTGGSIRWPAACVGVSGFKPTRGRIDTFGVMPLSPSLDHAGVLAAGALDAALAVDVLTTGPRRRDLADRLEQLPAHHPLRGLTVGVPAATDYFRGVPDDDQLTAFDAALDILRRQGATLRTVVTRPVPAPLADIDDLSHPILLTELAAPRIDELARRPLDFGPVIRARIAVGAAIPADDYAATRHARRIWSRRFLELFDDIDVFVHPEDEIAAPTADSGHTDPPPKRPSSGNKWRPWNLAGAPSISIPTGFAPASGMPLSMQCAAAPDNDAAALVIAHAFQLATDFHTRRPPLEGSARSR